MLFTLLVFIALLISLLIISYTVHLILVKRRYSHIPSPKGAWFYLGHIPVIIANLKKGKAILDLCVEWEKECGQCLVFWRYTKPIILTSDPESIKQIGLGKFPKPDQSFLKNSWHRQRLAGNSLFTIENYEEWKERRRVFDPSFARNYLQSLVPSFNEVTKCVLIDDIEKLADGVTVVDMNKKFAFITLQIISFVAFGSDFANDSYVKSIIGDKDILYLVRNSLEGAFMEFQNPLLPYVMPFRARKYTSTARQLREIGRYCVMKRIKAINNNEEVPRDILTNILSLTQKDDTFSIEDLVDDFVGFYIAGQETTSNLLAFTLILLLQHPDILNRVINEIDEVYEEYGAITVEALEKLCYTNAVLEEILRLYPPAPFFGRSITEDLSFCGYHIPKGTHVLSFAWGMSHNPQYFDDPSNFNPSRFEVGQKRPSPYVYFPFGFGHRSCIGRTFAMMEARVILAQLLHHFSFSLPSDYQYKIDHAVTIKPAGPIPCTITRRNL